MADMISARAGDAGAKAEGPSNHHNRRRRARQGMVCAIHGRDGIRRIEVRGRDLWALRALVAAGAEGVTPISNPAPRWSAYIFNLRALGFDIVTQHEAHTGQFAGHHARYRLHSHVELEAAP